MHCLKCGTEIQPPNVFCQNCLAEMKQYPVARDTPVVIQPRPAENPERRTRRPPKPEELLVQARRRQRWLARLCIILTVVCILLACALVFFPQLYRPEPTIGRNYSTETTASTETSAETSPQTVTTPSSTD